MPKCKPLVICLAGLLSATAQAGTDVETLLQEIKRLTQRVAQLEAQRSVPATDAGQQALAARLEDVESQVVALQKPARLMQAVEGVSVEAGLTMVAQHAGSGEVTGDRSQANYRADIEVVLPGGQIGEAQGQIYAHFRLGQGEGLTPAIPTYTATSNSTAFQLSNSHDSTALLAQAWYQLTLPLADSRGEVPAQFQVTIGKIDPFIFFDQNDIADDESTAFLNHAFVHNPLLDSGGDVGVDLHGFTPGLHLAYRNGSPGPNYWQVSYGLFGSGPGASFDGSFTKPFVIGQLEAGQQLIPGLNGTYRLYAWTNGRATAYDGMTEERHSGWGLSLNQQLAEHVELFARYGRSTQGQVRFDRAFTVGAEFNGSAWGREYDRLGLAMAWLETSDAYRMADPDAYGPGGAERMAEIYYAWQLNEHLEISPDLQFISRPAGNGDAKDLTVVGLRAKASF